MSQKISRCLLALVLGAVSAWAQNVTSSVKGAVVDTTQAAIPGAECVLTNPATGRVLMVTSWTDGSFTFPSVPAATYTLQIQAKGFKALTVNDVVVNANEVRTLGNVVLQIGELKETVAVSAEAAVVSVQLASGERSGLISGKQMNDLALKGRDFWALLATLPGVVDTNGSRETIGGTSNNGVTINGGGASSKNYNVDGIYALNSSNATTVVQPNMDAIDEVKVLTTNYQAEYGRMSSGVISVITKGGTRDFHGSAFEYFRNEDLNANNFYSNRTGTPRSKYRFNTWGYSVGGPAYIPKVFNTDRSKLFFFFSQEFCPKTTNYGSQFTSMPTALERTGDFSKSVDQNGALIVIKDPLTGTAFPGNVVPTSRISKGGQSILNFLPLPNYTDPDPLLVNRRNYRSTFSAKEPVNNHTLRMDYNIRPSMTINYRFQRNTQSSETPWGSWRLGNNFVLTPGSWRQPGNSHVVQVTKIFSPTLVNEARFGTIDQTLDSFLADESLVMRSKLTGVPQLFPDPGSPDYIPDMSFGSQPPSTATISLGPNPWLWKWGQRTYADNLSKVWSKHTLKTGFNLDFQYYNGASTRTQWRGQFDFGRNTSNPFDTNDGYSNALLGYYNSYTELNNRVPQDFTIKILEFYVQDNWRVTKRLTLDFGLRTMHQPTEHDKNPVVSHLDPSYFKTSDIPAMFVPALDPSRKRVGMNPLTGALVPQALIGMFVPGSGNYANGMKTQGVDGYYEGLYTRPFMFLAPRFGFAYDVFGNGKTAVRGGFGMFYDTPTGNMFDQSSGNPPVAYTPVQYYGNIDTMAASTGYISPTTISQQAPLGLNLGLPMNMNYSFGIQQQAMRNTVVEVSYVGSLVRHILLVRELNPIPLYSRFDPANTDPTTGKALPDNFLRPLRGYGSVTIHEMTGSSNYNSLQATLNRRFAKGFAVSASYTFSKALGVTSKSPYFAPRSRNYGPLDWDRTQVFVASYSYDLPKIGARTAFKPASWVLDNWVLSGITTFSTGAPFTPGFSTVDGQDITGSSEGARINVVGNPHLDPSERTYSRNFTTAAFARPALKSFGSAGANIMRNPGDANWDVSVAKRVPFAGEGRYLQIRGEAFNVWNHTRFSSYDSTARFDAAGNQVSTTFGSLNGARSPRTIELSARIVF